MIILSTILLYPLPPLCILFLLSSSSSFPLLLSIHTSSFIDDYPLPISCPFFRLFCYPASASSASPLPASPAILFHLSSLSSSISFYPLPSSPAILFHPPLLLSSSTSPEILSRISCFPSSSSYYPLPPLLLSSLFLPLGNFPPLYPLPHLLLPLLLSIHPSSLHRSAFSTLLFPSSCYPLPPLLFITWMIILFHNSCYFSSNSLGNFSASLSSSSYPFPPLLHPLPPLTAILFSPLPAFLVLGNFPLYHHLFRLSCYPSIQAPLPISILCPQFLSFRLSCYPLPPLLLSFSASPDHPLPSASINILFRLSCHFASLSYPPSSSPAILFKLITYPDSTSPLFPSTFLVLLTFASLSSPPSHSSAIHPAILPITWMVMALPISSLFSSLLLSSSASSAILFHLSFPLPISPLPSSSLHLSSSMPLMATLFLSSYPLPPLLLSSSLLLSIHTSSLLDGYGSPAFLFFLFCYPFCLLSSLFRPLLLSIHTSSLHPDSGSPAFLSFLVLLTFASLSSPSSSSAIHPFQAHYILVPPLHYFLSFLVPLPLFLLYHLPLFLFCYPSSSSLHYGSYGSPAFLFFSCSRNFLPLAIIFPLCSSSAIHPSKLIPLDYGSPAFLFHLVLLTFASFIITCYPLPLLLSILQAHYIILFHSPTISSLFLFYPLLPLYHHPLPLFCYPSIQAHYMIIRSPQFPLPTSPLPPLYHHPFLLLSILSSSPPSFLFSCYPLPLFLFCYPLPSSLHP
ncbi:unnamed protein product [Acanthosepion pharaonis]|uniref:Uncharacterized protein n=1 Tax=Acanthosepion pharaonis TaxID=158019 RepID=A0A812BIS1_ACAPH|nr:unnamed protein product [Sepia pharaonis]